MIGIWLGIQTGSLSVSTWISNKLNSNQIDNQLISIWYGNWIGDQIVYNNQIRNLLINIWFCHWLIDIGISNQDSS